MRILLVEDSASLLRSLGAGLSRLGHAVDTAADGESGLSFARANPVDVIVLDIMLPGMSGLEVLRTLRAGGVDTPVLLLTARDTVEDRVVGLRSGADDYLVKPFSFDELVARLEALERRRHGRAAPPLEVGDLVLDPAGRVATVAGRRVDLRRREFRLLERLARDPGRFVSREELEDSLYDERTFPMSNAIQVLVSRVRRRLAEAGSRTKIVTQRGVGYALVDEGA